MKNWKLNPKMAAVLMATGVTLALALSLAGRVAARTGDEPARSPGRMEDMDPGPAPPALVPSPRPLAVGELPTPFCWSCPGNDYRPLEFQIDLDSLAPLGDGAGNTALWLHQFSKDVGPRAGETAPHLERREIDGRIWKVLPPDNALLLEAEPWMDQARCSFYPEVLEFAGAGTRVPNLLFALNLARSWVARGRLATDPEAAKDDHRRAIRLGRLLRQDDLTLIQDLVAIASIRLGAEGLYEEARREGDAVTMTAAALVLSDREVMRHFAARRIRISTEVLESVKKGWFGGFSLEATDAQVDDLITLARRVPERRYKGEALVALQVVRQLGTGTQLAKVLELMNELAASDDELTAVMAAWVRDESSDPAGFLESMH